MLSCIFVYLHSKAHEDCAWKKKMENIRVFKKLKEIIFKIYTYVTRTDLLRLSGRSTLKWIDWPRCFPITILQALRDSYQLKLRTPLGNLRNYRLFSNSYVQTGTEIVCHKMSVRVSTWHISHCTFLNTYGNISVLTTCNL